MKRTLALIAIVMATPAAAYDLRGDHNSPKIYAPNGQYLGNLNNNPLDPNSINNPIGRYGSPLAPNGVNNLLSPYGNPVSPQYSNPYNYNR